MLFSFWGAIGEPQKQNKCEENAEWRSENFTAKREREREYHNNDRGVGWGWKREAILAQQPVAVVAAGVAADVAAEREPNAEF